MEDANISSSSISVVEEIDIYDLAHKVKMNYPNINTWSRYSTISSTDKKYSMASSPTSKCISVSSEDMCISNSSYSNCVSVSYGDSSASLCREFSSVSLSYGDLSLSSVCGNYSTSIATGVCSKAEVNGKASNSVAIATGYLSQADAQGDAGLAIATGKNGCAKGSLSSFLMLDYRNEFKKITKTWTGKVGENGIKPDTYYYLDENGNPQESKMESCHAMSNI